MAVSKGLIVAKNIHDLEAEEAAQSEEGQEYELQESRLASHIRNAWQKNTKHKHDIAMRMLNCLRARKGEYSDEELNRIIGSGGADPIYLKLTGTKSRAASSWIRDILLPSSGDWPFAIEPTPLQELPQEVEMSITASATESAMVASGEMTPQEFPKFLDKVRENVKVLCSAMPRKKPRHLRNRFRTLCLRVDGKNPLKNSLRIL